MDVVGCGGIDRRLSVSSLRNWGFAFAPLIVLVIALLIVLPSLLSLLLCAILVVACIETVVQQRRSVVRDMNSAFQAVCHKEGGIEKVALAFSRGGPLRGPSYEYARRLMSGENPVDAAVASRIPLQLGTAVAMESPRGVDTTLSRIAAETDFLDRDTALMPVYAQLIYLVGTAAVACLVLSFVGVFVIPTFEHLWSEFGVDVRYEWLLSRTPSALILAFVVFTVLVAVPILNSGRIFGLQLRWLPLLPSAARSKAEMLRGFADAVDSGWPLGRAMAVGHTITLRYDRRRRLEVAMQMIEQGQPAHAALVRGGWITAQQQQWFVGASPRRTADLMRVIADQCVRDAATNLQWLMSLFFPAVVIMIGMATLAYAFGFFAALMGLFV
jgi:hypothetical protein